MYLRKLKLNDAKLMLEWMHDPFVLEGMSANFISKTIDDCENFINNSINDKNLNLAIADDDDEYMGTVSLKHINNECSEFAIVICKKAMGKGYANYAMKEIIKLAFEKYDIDYVYWCVKKENKRAIKFYDKNGWGRVSISEIKISDDYSQSQIEKYLWYKIDNKLK